jgi:hypothetical protein
MRRFFLALGVGVEVVAGPLAHVVQPVQRPPDGVLGDPLPRGDVQGLSEQRHRPTHVRPVELLGRDGEEGLQQVRLVLVQEGAAPPPLLVLEGRGVEGFRVRLDPVVDGLPRHAEHAGDVGGGATLVELQHGKGPPKDARLPGLVKLASEASPLPGGQVEPAHRLLLDHRRS